MELNLYTYLFTILLQNKEKPIRIALQRQLTVYKLINHADYLSSSLRLNEISILTFLQFYCKIKRNQLELVIEGAYGLHSINTLKY